MPTNPWVTLRRPTVARLQDGFPALFDTYGQTLADHVAHAFPPQYRLVPSKPYLDRIRGLGRAPFPAQVQAAAALATRLSASRAAMIVGEASVGKTQIALTTAAMLGCRSVLIVAGSNLLGQWHDEIRKVLPHARVYTDVTSIAAVDRTMAEIHRSKGPSLVLLSRDQAKLGGPWRAAAVEVLANVPASPKDKARAPYCLGCKHILLRVLSATYLRNDGTERHPKGLISVPLHRLPKGAFAYCLECHKPAMMVSVDGPAPTTWATCPRCRHALATVRTEKKADPNSREMVEIPTKIEPWTREYLEAGQRKCPSCEEACWQRTRTLGGLASAAGKPRTAGESSCTRPIRTAGTSSPGSKNSSGGPASGLRSSGRIPSARGSASSGCEPKRPTSTFS